MDSKAAKSPENDVVVVVQRRLLNNRSVRSPQLKPDVIEHILRLRIHLLLRSWQAIYQPVQRVAFADSFVDEFAILCRDGLST